MDGKKVKFWLWSNLGSWMFSVPISVKIMGMGISVALIFGVAMIYYIYTSMSESLYWFLEGKANFMAITLAKNVEQPMLTGDYFGIHRHLRETRKNFPDLRYVIVKNREGEVVAHTFVDRVPPSLLAVEQSAISGKRKQILQSPEGEIFEVSVPLVDGKAGFLRLGVLDVKIRKKLQSTMTLLLFTLYFCCVLGLTLALLLVYLLTRPIQSLVEATRQIGEGNFEHKSKVFWDDEIGKLAMAFNRMCDNLQKYRAEVTKKEKDRLALIEKIVLAQEKERKSIGRDLHDQIGQSLLALLLKLQSLAEAGTIPSKVGGELDEQVRKIFDHAHHLSWGMQPSILDDYGLCHAMKHYIKQTTEIFDMKIDYHCSCPSEMQRLLGQVETTLYRIAQEAISNIGRHAKADQASVVLIRTLVDTTLLIEDDGIGFDPKILENEARTHLGLIGIRERASLLGGEFMLESTPGYGTILRIRIPFESERAISI